MGKKLEKNISQRRGGGMFDNGNVNWCILGRAFFCRTGHFSVEPGFFSVEPCILLSNRAFLCRTSVIITIITWHFQFHPVNVSNLRVKGTYVLEARAVSRAPPIVTSRGAPNDGNCRLTIPVVKGRCAREALPHALNIGVFEYGKSNPTSIKHIYDESENLNGSCDAAFDSNNWWNLP